MTPSTAAQAADALVIDPRHNGPPTSGNGGWVAGALARRLGVPVVSVALRAPIPLGLPLQVVRQPDGTLALHHGSQLVADAAPATLALAVPPAPDDDTAEAAGVAARLRHQARGLGDAYARCFACGFARPDGLGVIVGPVGDDGLMATVWTPPASLADSDGTIAPEATWAALDCPAGMAWSHRLARSAPIVTARMTATIDRPLRAGERLRVLAWPLHREGRKLHAGTAIVDAQGVVRARSLQLWLLPREA
jgi:hypothetical protein